MRAHRYVDEGKRGFGILTGVVCGWVRRVSVLSNRQSFYLEQIINAYTPEKNGGWWPYPPSLKESSQTVHHVANVVLQVAASPQLPG